MKTNYLLSVSIILFFSFSTLSSFSQMSGTYTIGPSGSVPAADFTSIQDAFDDLENSSINGAVVLRVLDGSYTENTRIFDVAGVSSTNTITLISDSEDQSKVIIHNDPNSYLGNLMYISCPFFHVKKMTFIYTSSVLIAPSYVYEATLITYDEGIVVQNNVFETVNCNYERRHLAITYGDNGLVINNTFKGESSTGIAVRFSNNVEVTNNNIDDCDYGISVYISQDISSDNVLIADNDITEVRYGIVIDKATNPKILRNRIDGRAWADVEDIYVGNNDCGICLLGELDPATSVFKIRNNMISKDDTGINYNAIFVSAYSTYILDDLEGFIEYNSINIVADEVYSNSPTYGIRIASESGDLLRVRCNSVKLNGENLTGLSYYNTVGSDWPTSNYNNVYRINANGNSDYGEYHNLSAIKNNTTMETNSIAGNPKYVSNTDLHIVKSSKNINKGVVNTAVIYDYDKDDRIVNYDIGADEYGSLGNKSFFANEISLKDDDIAVLNIYPNPSTNYFHLNFENEEIHDFEIYTSFGQLIKKGTLTSGERINVTDLSNGLYILNIPTLTESSAVFQILR